VSDWLEVEERVAYRKTSRPDELEDQVAILRGYRATYLSVVERARAVPGSDITPALVLRTLNRFEALERELLEATTEDAQDNILERAEEVEQSRAYIQPEAELVAESTTLIADMADWGVPKPVLQAITNDQLNVIKSAGADLHKKRAALNKLYQYYDAWEAHVRDYESWATRTTWFLGALLIATAAGCVCAVYQTEPLVGFALAGLAGAMLSVLHKFPPMLGWGQWASYTPRMLGRITTGVVTSLAGGALLSTDVIRVGHEDFKLLFETPDTMKMLLLVGLGIVFGFSERAFVQFQNLVFTPKDETSKDETPKDKKTKEGESE